MEGAERGAYMGAIKSATAAIVPGWQRRDKEERGQECKAITYPSQDCSP